MINMNNMKKKMTSKNLVIAAIVILFIAAAYYGYNKFAVPLINRQKTANMEHNNRGASNIADREATVLFFYADWCPHCKKVKEPSGSSIWDKIQTNEKVGNNMIVNGYVIKYKGVNCTDNKNPETQKALDKYKVEGFPTFKIAKGTSEIIEFDAKPEVESLERFILTTLSQ